MALIQCNECGKDISDKALTCPHCGVPIDNGAQDIQLVCPKCNSQHITTVAQSQGFSKVKGISGMLLFGGIGLLAGLPGKDKIKISCSECGYLFDAGTAVKIPISEKAKTEMESKIMDIIRRDGLLSAIQYYKETFNTDLSTSKAYVDSVNAKNRRVTPPAPTTQSGYASQSTHPVSSNSGCLGVMLVMIAVTLAIAFI